MISSAAYTKVWPSYVQKILPLINYSDSLLDTKKNNPLLVPCHYCPIWPLLLPLNLTLLIFLTLYTMNLSLQRFLAFNKKNRRFITPKTAVWCTHNHYVDTGISYSTDYSTYFQIIQLLFKVAQLLF
jgi:hypothetical protein